MSADFVYKNPEYVTAPVPGDSLVKLQGVSTTACADLKSFQEAEALLARVVRYVHITVLSLSFFSNLVTSSGRSI